MIWARLTPDALMTKVNAVTLEGINEVAARLLQPQELGCNFVVGRAARGRRKH